LAPLATRSTGASLDRGAFEEQTGTTTRPNNQSAPGEVAHDKHLQTEQRRRRSMFSRDRGPVPYRRAAGIAWVATGRRKELLIVDPIGLIAKGAGQAKRLGAGA